MSDFPLTWIEDTHDLGPAGRHVERRASAEERKSVADSLGLLACDELTFDYDVKARSAGRCSLQGTLKAEIVQACVVSLEPVAATIEEQVAVEFWPSHMLEEQNPEAGDRAVLDADDPEPLAPNGRIEVGRLAFEVVSAGLDPYPRKAGTEFDWSQADTESQHGDSPFAALQALKREQGEG